MPIGPIEAEELRWYLGKYAIWPSEYFRDRARKVEQSLVQWGKLLHEAALPAEHATNVMNAWARIDGHAACRFSVHVDATLEAGVPEDDVETAREAATLTVLELSNLFAVLEQVQRAGDAEATIGLATSLYPFLQNLGKPRLLERVAQVPDAAAEALGDVWNHARLQAQRTRIEQQHRYKDALEAHAEASEWFTRLDEPGTVGVSWHQTGMVYLEAGQPEAAEDASLLQQQAADPEADWLRPFVQALQAIVTGSRDRTLADVPELNYSMAAEILFLIETLEQPP